VVQDKWAVRLGLGVLCFAAFCSLFPIVLLLLNSLKSAREIIISPLAWPMEFRWDNFARAWQDARFDKAIVNSLIIVVLTVFAVCTTASAAAYVLARRLIKRWQLATIYFLVGTTAPIQLFLFPLYLAYSKLGLINNPFGVALIYTAIFSPVAIMLLRTFFIAIPIEVEEAAEIDGANAWQKFTLVALPIAWPGVLTVALIVAMNTWNEFVIAATFLQTAERMTAIGAFFSLSGQYVTDWGEVMAAALIVVIPIVTLFIFFQRQFIEGMAGGAVKG